MSLRVAIAGISHETNSYCLGQTEAAELPDPVRITITSSPKHGIDESLEVAVRLREHGHGITLHLAARGVRDESHLSSVLETAGGAGIDAPVRVADLEKEYFEKEDGHG